MMSQESMDDIGCACFVAVELWWTYSHDNCSVSEYNKASEHESWTVPFCQIWCLRSSIVDNPVEPALEAWPEGFNPTVCRTNICFGEFCRPNQEH